MHKHFNCGEDWLIYILFADLSFALLVSYTFKAYSHSFLKVSHNMYLVLLAHIPIDSHTVPVFRHHNPMTYILLFAPYKTVWEFLRVELLAQWVWINMLIWLSMVRLFSIIASSIFTFTKAPRSLPKTLCPSYYLSLQAVEIEGLSHCSLICILHITL